MVKVNPLYNEKYIICQCTNKLLYKNYFYVAVNEKKLIVASINARTS